MARKQEIITCSHCEIEFLKDSSEIKRNLKLNRLNYCSISCAGKGRDNSHLLEWSHSEENKILLKFQSGNRRDEFSPFRYTLRHIQKRNKEVDIDLIYLKELWESQHGMCSYTKIPLVLPTDDKYTITDHTTRASLDRIDSSKGYIKGNVQFISTVINYMKSTMTHEETLNFLQLVINNLSFDKDQTISSSQINEMLDANSGN